MKKFLAATTLLLATFCLSLTVLAEESKGFTSVSYNNMDWDGKTDNQYIEVEKGGVYNWGTFYGFVDVEQFDKYSSSEDVKLSVKTVFTVNQEIGINDYVQIFAYAEKDFQVLDAVYGKQLTFNGDKWWFNPFAGIQYSAINNNFANTSFEGVNGAMIGWTAGYSITDKIQITNWHEFTTMRSSEYLATSGETSDLGMNGALSAWYHFTPNFTTGIQWRYADNKLGSSHGSNAIIYTVKVNF